MTSGRRERTRKLSERETALWSEFVRSVAPLTRSHRHDGPEPGADGERPIPESRHHAGEQPAATSPAQASGAKPGPAREREARVRPAGVQTTHATNPGPKPAVTQPFDARSARRLARKHLEIDAVLDLHGMRQQEAHNALRHFLGEAHRRGHRFVKVITGKGGPAGETGDVGRGSGASEVRRGVLREMVPRWLEEVALRQFVVSYTSAGRAHGGEGALYIHVRRAGRS
ncbi:MAG: DNA mismatch repair protein MutS [Rhizobiales bacterium]|nr:DNA mismatch repair protein MutS [Hyphomicrobiales bacterium]